MKTTAQKEAQHRWRNRHREHFNELKRKYYHRNKNKIKIKRHQFQKLNSKRLAMKTSVNRINRRTIARQRATEEKIRRGGACIICGYSKDLRALIWHHKNPITKEENISKLIIWANIPKLIEELKKCDLVCANCHTIMEYKK